MNDRNGNDRTDSDEPLPCRPAATEGVHGTPGRGGDPGPVSRRAFLRSVAVGGTALLGGGPVLPPLLASCDSSTGPAPPVDPTWNPLRLAPQATPRDLTLVAAEGLADVGGGVTAPAWLLNDTLPSPLLRTRTGQSFQVVIHNQLPQDLILHWHGLAPPEEMDGHPRFAVGPGGSYTYHFTVQARAGTYWYHSHTHRRTAEQTYRGIGGLLIVEDQEEDALDLPKGAREIPLILQDRRTDASGVPFYAPFGPDLMAGYMGDEPFGNGIRRPFVEVDSALYRLRILNGSNARIFRLARSDGGSLILIGNDGGLTDRARHLSSVDLGPAERVDLLLDLSEAAEGDRLMLRSSPFSLTGGGFMGGANLQGLPLDLLEFRVTRSVEEPPVIPDELSTVPGPSPEDAVRERTFRFTSQMMDHRINGRSFEMDRIDEIVPFGETEIWSFVNESNLPHPVHLHATHFRVVSRTGGRGQVMPWEAGVKDTVLLHPFETVRVAVRFTAHRGLFLLHCHNLEHEDMGMMANILVE
jgi:FtsP/CotA-like multicopper oxidase with cupredoxin domain